MTRSLCTEYSQWLSEYPYPHFVLVRKLRLTEVALPRVPQRFLSLFLFLWSPASLNLCVSHFPQGGGWRGQEGKILCAPLLPNPNPLLGLGGFLGNNFNVHLSLVN